MSLHPITPGGKLLSWRWRADFAERESRRLGSSQREIISTQGFQGSCHTTAPRPDGGRANAAAASDRPRHHHRVTSGADDVITDEDVIGHSIVFTYTAGALQPTADLIRSCEPLLKGEQLAPE
jgi:hypothetical protein